MRTIDAATLGIRTPHDRVSIQWEVDGTSGSTQCEAWLGQYNIDRLEAAGYTIVSIECED